MTFSFKTFIYNFMCGKRFFLRAGCSALFCVFLLNSGCTTLYKKVGKYSDFTILYKIVANYTVGFQMPFAVHFERIREATPCSPEMFAQLKPGSSTLDDALQVMGAPRIVRRTQMEEILEYHYFYARHSHFKVRPLNRVLPNTISRLIKYDYYGNHKGSDIVALVFDHEGTLTRKEFRRSAPSDTVGGNMKSIFAP